MKHIEQTIGKTNGRDKGRRSEGRWSDANRPTARNSSRSSEGSGGYLFDALDDREFWGHVSYKLSARNRFRARITGVQKGSITSQVKMMMLEPVALTSIISNDSVEDLALKEGDEVEAIVKSTEVIIGKRT